MPGLGKTAAVPGSAGISPARSQEIYRRYAVALYRQALLNLGDPAPTGHLACEALVNERALAAIPERGAGAGRYRRAEPIFRRSRQLAAGSAPYDRRSGPGALGLALFGGWGYIRVSAVLGIHPYEVAALLREVLRKLATSPPAPAEDSDQVGGLVPPAITGEAKAVGSASALPAPGLGTSTSRVAIANPQNAGGK